MKRKVIGTIHLHDFGVQNRSLGGVYVHFFVFVSFNITSKRGWTWQVLLLEEHQLIWQISNVLQGLEHILGGCISLGFLKHQHEYSTCFWYRGLNLKPMKKVWKTLPWRSASPPTKGGFVLKGPWSTQDEWEWWSPSILSRWYNYMCFLFSCWKKSCFWVRFFGF